MAKVNVFVNLVKLLGQGSPGQKSRSQMKGLVMRYLHVKCQSSSCYSLKVGQNIKGHKVKSYGIKGKVWS